MRRNATMSALAFVVALGGAARADVRLTQLFDHGEPTTWTLRYGVAFDGAEGDETALFLSDQPIACGTDSADIHGVFIAVGADRSATAGRTQPGDDPAKIPPDKVKLSRKVTADRVRGTLAFDHVDQRFRNKDRQPHFRASGAFDVKRCKRPR
jgi:hypothetical protein